MVAAYRWSNAYCWSSSEDHPLRRYARRMGWSDEQLLNGLQDNGIVSDNCVTIDDVGNWPKAMMWAHENAGSFRGVENQGVSDKQGNS
jgi:hypothetical protein